MEPSPAPKVWTDEKLMALPKTGGKSELVGGELVMTATGFRHDMLVAQLLTMLNVFVQEHAIGTVQGPDLGYRMANGNVRCPDVSFISAARARRYVEEESNAFFEGAPDLAVEILSPSDRIGKTKQKAFEYFNNGCRLVWVLDPANKTVLVMEPECPERLLKLDDTLDGGSVLPGFTVSLEDLFARPRFR